MTTHQHQLIQSMQAGTFHYRLGKDVNQRTVLSLGKAGLIRYCISGGWAAVSFPPNDPGEPREPIYRDNLHRILATEGHFPDHWGLFSALNPLDKSECMTYQAMRDAIHYGIRKGYLTIKGKTLQTVEGKPILNYYTD